MPLLVECAFGKHTFDHSGSDCSLQIERSVKIFSAKKIVTKLCFPIVYEFSCSKIAV